MHSVHDMMYYQSVGSGHHPRPQTSPLLPGQHHDVPVGSRRLSPPTRLRGEGLSRRDRPTGLLCVPVDDRRERPHVVKDHPINWQVRFRSNDQSLFLSPWFLKHFRVVKVYKHTSNLTG